MTTRNDIDQQDDFMGNTEINNFDELKALFLRKMIKNIRREYEYWPKTRFRKDEILSNFESVLRV